MPNGISLFWGRIIGKELASMFEPKWIRSKAKEAD